MSQIHPISFERHGKKQIKPLNSWAFAAEYNLAPLVVSEFPQAAQSFPIVFVKSQPDADTLAPFALLGLAQSENLFLGQNNQWLSGYIPAFFRRYPFAMARIDAQKQEFALCVDEGSGLLADSGGVPLFEADGKKSPALEKAFNFTAEYQKLVPMGEMLCGLLQELELFSPLEINVERGGKKTKLQGLFRIDEAKVNALADDDFLKLRNKGVLPLVYAHWLSLGRISELAKLQQQQQSTTEPKAAVTQLPDRFSF
jgi:hypothetical protein